MGNEPQHELMVDTGTNDPSSISQLPTPYYSNGLPTSLTATAPNFPASIVHCSPSTSPMSDPLHTTKGRGKRSAEDSGSGNVFPLSQSAGRSTAPRVVRRHHHRRRNVAATVWGPQISSQALAPGQPFNVYKTILRHPNLFFQFAVRLPPSSIIDLYAVDKEFHYRFNKYSTSIIHDHASYHAPEAAFVFSWVLFPELCISDPMLKPMDGRPHLARDIPSLRWTKMVIIRDTLVQALLAELSIEGHRVPQQAYTTLMKYWVLMGMDTVAMRTAFLSDRSVWTDFDIVCFYLFLIKLDMRFSDPVAGNGMCALSHLLLSQKSLSTLVKVLVGTVVIDYDEASDMLIRTYLTEDVDADTHTWLDDEVENGVPIEEWGLLCRDGWDMDGERMEPALDMVLMEGIGRNIPLPQHLLDFVLYGYVDFDTGENIPAPRRFRREKTVVLPKFGWPKEEARISVLSRLDSRFGVEEETTPRMVRRLISSAGLVGDRVEFELRDDTGTDVMADDF